MSKGLKIFLIIVGVIVVFGVVLKSTGVIKTNDKSVEVKTTKAFGVTIVETVTSSGKIQPEIEVKISPEVSGEIIELPVKEGEKVKKGDLLLKINPDVYESSEKRAIATVNSAKANVSQSEAQYTEAKKNYDRYKKLYEQDVISDADFESYQRAYTVADLSRQASKSQLESAKATLKETRDNLKRTTILAPQDGTISRLNVELGERVVGTAQMAGTEVLRVANLGNMEVLVDVNENDIVKVSVGDTAGIEVDAYLDEMFFGVVTEIANSANTLGVSSDQVTNFEVKIKILRTSYEHLIREGQESPFRPGMTASVDIRTEVVRNILAVPIQAVTIRSDTSATAKKKYGSKNKTEAGKDDEEFEVVFILENGKAKIAVVKTGIQDDKNIQILEGLKEGDIVIKGPYSVVAKDLKNNMVVSSDDDYDEPEEKDED